MSCRVRPTTPSSEAQAFQSTFHISDVKPANLLLTLEGHVKLMDFASAARTVQVGGLSRALKRYCMMPVGTVDYVRRCFLSPVSALDAIANACIADCTRHTSSA